jgi:hypothetical protein
VETYASQRQLDSCQLSNACFALYEPANEFLNISDMVKEMYYILRYKYTYVHTYKCVLMHTWLRTCIRDPPSHE